MKKPIIYSKGFVDTTDKPTPIFSQGDYDVFVGAFEEDKLPSYIVINRDTNVVEFSSEVTLAYRGFLDHVAPVKLSGADAAQQLDLSLAN